MDEQRVREICIEMIQEAFRNGTPKCTGCGTTESITFDADPYASEVGNCDDPVWMCYECRVESARST